MKHFLCITSFLICFSGFCQSNVKPTYYLDVGGNYISKDLFLGKKKFKKGQPMYHSLYFENDTSYINMLHPRKKYGRLKPKEHTALRGYLDSLNANSIDANKFIVIQWYPGKDPCNNPLVGNSQWNRYNKGYLRKLKKTFNHEMLWIYKNDENLEKHRKGKLNWLHDDKTFIERLFFKYHFGCGSFVVVSPEGNYIAFYGEYGDKSVLEVCEEMKK